MDEKATEGKKLAQALSFHQANNLDQAKTLYQEIVQTNPKHADALHLLGMISAQENKLPEALEYLRQAIQYNAESPVFHNNLGTLYEENDQPDQSEEHYLKALSLQCNYPDAHNNLGHLYLDQNKLVQAEHHLKQALQIDDQHLKAHFNMARLHQVNHDVDKAIQEYLNTLRLNPNHLPAYVNLGILLHAQHKIQEAINCLQYVVLANPNHISAHYHLSLIYIGTNDFSTAKQHLNTILSIDSNHLKSLVRLFLIAVYESDWDTMVYYSDKAFHVHSNHFRHEDFLLVMYAYGLSVSAQWSALESVKDKVLALLSTKPLISMPLEILPYACHHFITDKETHEFVLRQYSEKLSISNYAVFSHPSLSNKPIQVGYVIHAQTDSLTRLFFDALIQYHNTEQFSVQVYDLSKPDCNVSYLALAQRINQKQTQILIDMTGYTASAMPQVYAAHPAPIQLELNYSGELGNPNLKPLPRDYIALEPLDDLAYDTDVLDKLPTSSSSCFVLGCFHDMNHITQSVFDSWLEILKLSSNTVLVLRVPSSEIQKRLKNHAETQQVDSDRFFFVDTQTAPYQQPYDRIDLYLDPFEGSGGLYTAAALYYQTPCIALKAQSNGIHQGALLLERVKMTDLIVHTKEEYIQKANQFIQNSEITEGYQHQLTNQGKPLPLFDTKTAVKEFEYLLSNLCQ